MKLKTIGLAVAFAMTSSLACAQAPIGSSADHGNGAVINRGPVPTIGEDRDYQSSRSPGVTTGSATPRRERRAPQRVAPNAEDNAPVPR